MLPKIISNITLAFIAIVLVYMLAPLFRDMLGGIFNPSRPKKKSHSKDEFDEMVKRKIERMSITGQQTEAIKETSKNSNRTFLSYFDEKNLYSTQEDKVFFNGLLSSLQWGDFPGQDEIIEQLKKDYHFNADEIRALLNSNFKEVFKKEHLLKITKITNDKLSKKDFLSYASMNLLRSYNANFKHKRYDDKIYNLLTSYILKKDKLDVIESYINNTLANCTDSINILYVNFHKKLNKSYDELFPIIEIDSQKIRKEFKSIEDKDQRKKKYKKQAQVYHPDKWHNAHKSQIIDERLNENFSNIKEIFNQLND